MHIWLSSLLLLLALPALARAAPDGAALYAAHCAVCHGGDGGGGVGVPLRLPAFLSGVDDDYLRKTVRVGRPGRVMPAFPMLDDDQIEAIVGHLRSWSDAPAPRFSAEPVAGDAARGARLYATFCSSCHGADGEGGTGTGVTFSRPRQLPIVAPALNNPGFLASAKDQMIRHTLMHGREGTPMVSYLDVGFSQRNIDDVVSFIRSFQQRRSARDVPPAHPPSFVMESSYSLQETVENVKRAAEGRNFRIIRTQYLEQGMGEEDEVSTRQVVVHFCNFSMLNEVLAIDPRVGLFLPCRITVVEREGRVEVMSINPMQLSSVFNNTELHRMCETMSDTYREIMEEATL